MKNRIGSSISPAGSRTRRTVSALFLVGGVWLGVATLAGCSYVAAAAYIIEGPPTVDAVAELDSSRQTVILIDDRGNGDRMFIPRKALQRQIGRVAEGILIDKGVIDAEHMIRSADAQRVAATESSTSPMSIVDIGRAVGAEVVVYVDVKGFAITRDGSTVAPAAGMQVKIFDAVNNSQLWPDAGEHYELPTQLPRRPREVADLDRNDLREIEEALAVYMGQRIAQMFYKTQRVSPIRAGT